MGTGTGNNRCGEVTVMMVEKATDSEPRAHNADANPESQPLQIPKQARALLLCELGDERMRDFDLDDRRRLELCQQRARPGCNIRKRRGEASSRPTQLARQIEEAKPVAAPAIGLELSGRLGGTGRIQTIECFDTLLLEIRREGVLTPLYWPDRGNCTLKMCGQFRLSRREQTSVQICRRNASLVNPHLGVRTKARLRRHRQRRRSSPAAHRSITGLAPTSDSRLATGMTRV
jgi:hypothetical protein